MADDRLIIKNGFIITEGTSEVSGSLNVSSITGSLLGTSSYSISASYAPVFPYTGSAQITGSLGMSGSLFVSGSSGNSTIDISSTTGGQIRFPINQNSSSNASTLDDYEEGTYTPTLGSTGNTFNYTTQVGIYTKIGNQVFVAIRIKLNTSGNTFNFPGNSVNINLPAGLNSMNYSGYSVIADARWLSNQSTSIRYVGFIDSNSSIIQLFRVSAATTGITTAVTAGDLGLTTGAEIQISLSYLTST